MIQLNNISKQFLGQSQPLFVNLNLSIAATEFCVILGSNGSGKSSLLKLITGECLPDHGTIQCSESIAQIKQDINLSSFTELSVLENLILSLHNPPKLRPYSRHKATIHQHIKALNINDLLDKPMRLLSGGQKQILAVAMAIHSERKILLLDEHTAALDPVMQTKVMEYTAQEIQKRQLTTLMITHQIQDALRYGNRLILLNRGKIVLDVSHTDKQNLRKEQLINLFHHEDTHHVN